jgi:cysteine-rich repeat protein
MRNRLLSSLGLLSLASVVGCTFEVHIADDDGVTVVFTQGGSDASGGSGGASGGAQSSGGAGASDSSGGSGGGPVMIENDNCPGQEVVLNVGDTQSFQATTNGATDSAKTFCADVDASTAAPDVAYRVTIGGECSLRVVLSQLTFDGVVSLRRTVCTDEEPGDLCLNFQTGTAQEQTAVRVDAGVYYVIVDGANGEHGDFRLTLDCLAPSCGDGIINTGEECDPGDALADDGCIDPGAPGECNFEPANAELETCPGLAIPVANGADIRTPTVYPLRTTLNAADNYQGEGVCSGDVGGRDHVYQLVTGPDVSGSITVMLGEDPSGADLCADPFDFSKCWDRILYVRSGDCATGAQLACANDEIDYAAKEFTEFPVAPNTSYWVFVDGYFDPEAGPYSLHIIHNP